VAAGWRTLLTRKTGGGRAAFDINLALRHHINPILGREELVVLQVRDLLHDRCREHSDVDVAWDVGSFCQCAQAQRTVTRHVDLPEKDRSFFIREHQSSRVRVTNARRAVLGDRDEFNDLVGARLYDADLIVEHKIAVAAIFRHN